MNFRINVIKNILANMKHFCTNSIATTKLCVKPIALRNISKLNRRIFLKIINRLFPTYQSINIEQKWLDFVVKWGIFQSLLQGIGKNFTGMKFLKIPIGKFSGHTTYSRNIMCQKSEKFSVNGLDWLCNLAGNSQTALTIIFF